MKPEELLFSLEHVGEDLLAGAEQTVQARKRGFPWAGAAAAAAVMIAVGLGGFLLWNRLPGARPGVSGADLAGTSAAWGDPTGAGLETEPPDPTREGPDPPLTLGDAAGLEYTRTFDDIDDWLSRDTWTQSGAIASLPVYRNEAWTEEAAEAGQVNYYTEGQLQTLLRGAAARFGAVLSDEISVIGYDPGGRPDALRAETDLGTLTVRGDGRCSLLFNEANILRPDAKFEAVKNEGVSERDLARLLRAVYMNACADLVRDWLDLPQSLLISCPDWNEARSSYHAWTLCPERADQKEQLLSRTFEQTLLLTNDGFSVRGVEITWQPWSEFVSTEPSSVPAYLTMVGVYPILSPEEAAEQVRLGNYLYEGEVPEYASLALLDHVELIYPTETCQQILMPYYRFWVPLGDGRCAALYVPAVRPEYLTDWPRTFDAEARPRKLPVGTVGLPDDFPLLRDPEAYLASNPWRESWRLNTLPVYQIPDAAQVGVSGQAMRGFLDQVLTMLDASVTGDLGFADKDLIREAVVETNLGTLCLDCGGDVTLIYDEAHRYTPSLGSPSNGGEAETGLLLAFGTRLVTDGLYPLGTVWSPVEGVCPTEAVLPGLPAGVYAAEIFPKSSGDEKSQLLRFCFDRVRLYYRDGTLYGFTLPAAAVSGLYDWGVTYGDAEDAWETTVIANGLLGFAGGDSFIIITDDGESVLNYTITGPSFYKTPWTMDIVGHYPIISPAEARTRAAESVISGSEGGSLAVGFFQTEEVPDFDTLPMDLIYLPNEAGEYMLPFYRFLIPCGKDGEATRCAVCLVCAVNPMFLLDAPVTTVTPTEKAEEALPADFKTPDDDTVRAVTALFADWTDWYCRAALSLYTEPLEADLEVLFYIGLPEALEDLSAEELAGLAALGRESPFGQWERIPGAEADAVLERLFGLTRADYVRAGVGTLDALLGKDLAYLPEFDCYYSCRTDAVGGPMTIRAIGRRQEDGLLAVVFDNERTVSLRPDGDGWRIAACLNGEWNVPAPED